MTEKSNPWLKVLLGACIRDPENPKVLVCDYPVKIVFSNPLKCKRIAKDSERWYECEIMLEGTYSKEKMLVSTIS